MAIKVVIVVSVVIAAVFWGFAAAGVFADWGPEQAEGRMAVTSILAGTATLGCLACWLDRRRESRDRERDERDRERNENVQFLIKTLSGAFPEKPVKRVKPFPRAL